MSGTLLSVSATVTAEPAEEAHEEDLLVAVRIGLDRRGELVAAHEALDLAGHRCRHARQAEQLEPPDAVERQHLARRRGEDEVTLARPADRQLDLAAHLRGPRAAHRVVESGLGAIEQH